MKSVSGISQSDVFMQGFYWNSPPGGIWYDSLARLAPRLAAGGFSAIWFPPPTKGASGAFSMGYDPYDQYDFGSYNQEGTVETRFGSRQELINAINAYHASGIKVYADAVMGHLDGGEREVPYDCDISPTLPESAWLIFNYPNGSGRFKKSAIDFYPNHLSSPPCDWNPANYHGVDPAYKFGEYLALSQSQVGDSLTTWGHYLRNVLGFDGFRLDEAKALDPVFMGPWLQAVDTGGFAVAEYFDNVSNISNWHYQVQNVNGGTVSNFDFPLRFALQAMCDATDGSYDMTQLDYAGLVAGGMSGYNVVTFAENHDFDRIGWDGSVGSGHNPIVYDKHMAYAFIMFSEGRPCVFFKDYFTYGLSGKIDTLNWIRANFLGGGTTKRNGLNPYYIREDNNTDQGSLASDIYVARRDGYNSQPGGYLVINDNATYWIDVWVDTDYPVGTVFRDYTGHDVDKVVVGPTGGDPHNRIKLWALPRNYSLYVADTTKRMILPPYIIAVPPQTAYLNTPFSCQLIYGNTSNNPLTVSLVHTPAWLSISTTGLISGTPDTSAGASAPVTVQACDGYGDTATTSFTITIMNHPVIDGVFEGEGVWGSPVDIADTIVGFDTAQVKKLYVTSDNQYFYFGALVKASLGLNWAFLINTKGGGGTSDSWSRSIVYSHPDPPDYIIRGQFSSYAEFHTWTGSYWAGVGTPMASGEYGVGITSSSPQDGWVETRILKSSIGNPAVLGVQCFLTGNANANATFDACPDDENTTAATGITTHLHYYAIWGTPQITFANLQYPGSVSVGIGNSTSVYARVYGIRITDSTGQGAGIQAWIGYNSSNTNPSGWTTWLPAAYNIDANGADEYAAAIGSSITTSGTYYYASRFQFNGGNFVYGGYSLGGGGFWDSLHYSSGILNILGPPATPLQTTPSNGSVNEATSTSFQWNAISNAQTYRIQVALDSAFSQMLLDDSTVSGTSRQITGLVYGATYYWHIRAKNQYGISSYSPAWSFRVSRIFFPVRIRQGWNMISLPVAVLDGRKNILYPQALGSAFYFSLAGSYEIADSLLPTVGYWLKYPQDDTVSLNGYPLSNDTLHLTAGWNMIGTITDSLDTDSLLQIPSGNVISPYFTFLNGYATSQILVPGSAYWVKTNADGQLVLAPAQNGHAVPAVTAMPDLSRLTKMVIRDAAGDERTLFFGETNVDPTPAMAPDMPPLPPAGIFDARFSADRSIVTVTPAGHKEVPLRIQGGAYPLTIAFRTKTGNVHSEILIDGQAVRIDSSRLVSVASPSSKIILHLAGSRAIPAEYSLLQNYPNPFNPSTTIEYQLPTESRVVLKVYSIIGDLVAILRDDVEPAGYKSAEWTPQGLSSGVYFYRLEANALRGNSGAFIQQKKMLILR